VSGSCRAPQSVDLQN